MVDCSKALASSVLHLFPKLRTALHSKSVSPSIMPTIKRDSDMREYVGFCVRKVSESFINLSKKSVKDILGAGIILFGFK
jgi:hypothetical protein